jgi:trans-aconitate methyltransferase
MTSQNWDPERYARNARFVSDLGMPVVELLAPVAGERVLDLGCGDGASTKKLVDIGCLIVGVDGSGLQVEAAKRLGLDARVMDGEHLTFEQEFDAVFSNAALHWMKRGDAVICGVARALKPGGRFVAELGGCGCVAKIESALVAGLDRRGFDGKRANRGIFQRRRSTGGGWRCRGSPSAIWPLSRGQHRCQPTITGWLETFAQS